jgi:dipeptidyl aminopeptidase/acylaminoacyl peptidase
MSANIPPTLLIHGDTDDAVAVGPVDDFYDKMKAIGAPIEYVRIEGGDHGVAYEKKLEITKPAMDNFFKKHLKK